MSLFFIRLFSQVLFQLNEWNCFGSCLLSFWYECLLRGLILFCYYTSPGSQKSSLTLAAGLWSSVKNVTCDVWVRNMSHVQTLLRMKAYYSFLSGEHWRGEPLSTEFQTMYHWPWWISGLQKKLPFYFKLLVHLSYKYCHSFLFNLRKKDLFQAYSPNCLVKWIC